MTTSVPLHILFVMSALLLIADDLFIISPHLLLVNNFFQFFQLFYLSAVFCSHTAFLRCFYVYYASFLFYAFLHFLLSFVFNIPDNSFVGCQNVLSFKISGRNSSNTFTVPPDILFKYHPHCPAGTKLYILSFSCSPTAGTLYPYESVLYTGFLITLIPLLYYRKGRQ